MTYSYDRRTASGWENADPVHVDDAISQIDDDFKKLARYGKQAEVLVPVFRRLAEALETPKIGVFADRIEEAVRSIQRAIELLKEGKVLCRKFDDEIQRLAAEVAGGRTLRNGMVAEVLEFPIYGDLLRVGRELDQLSKKLYALEIDWTLEDYLGFEAKIARRIEKVSPGDFENAEAMLESSIFGILQYYTDADYLEELVEDAKP